MVDLMDDWISLRDKPTGLRVFMKNWLVLKEISALERKQNDSRYGKGEPEAVK